MTKRFAFFYAALAPELRSNIDAYNNPRESLCGETFVDPEIDI